jgi:hypothetical protein
MSTSSQTKTIPILDSLRPYLKAINMICPNPTGAVCPTPRLFRADSPTKLYLNGCFKKADGSSYNNDDIAPEFLYALIKFGEEVSEIDESVTRDSPIGLINDDPRQIKLSNMFSLNQPDGGYIYRAISQSYGQLAPEVFGMGLSDYVRNNPQLFKGQVINNADGTINLVDFGLSDNEISKILTSIKTQVNSQAAFKVPDCTSFVNALAAVRPQDINTKSLNAQNIPNNKEAVLLGLYASLYDQAKKAISANGRKCFEIPHKDYNNTQEVRDIIDLLLSGEVIPEESQLFFSIFEIISGGRTFNNIGQLKMYTNSDQYRKFDMRINLKPSVFLGPGAMGVVPSITTWIPTLLTGGKVYFNADPSVYIDSSVANGQIPAALFLISAGQSGKIGLDDEELEGLKDRIKVVKAYGQSRGLNSKTILSKCTSTPIGQAAVLGTVQGQSAPASTSNTNTGVPVVVPSTGPSTINTKVGDFLKSASKPSSSVDRYLEVFRFDRNDIDEIQQLNAYKNGWSWNGSKYSKQLGKTTIEFDPLVADDVTITNFITTQCDALGKGVADCNTILETILSDDVNTRTLNDLLIKSGFSVQSSSLKDIHPKLAKKVLKNFGFKEVQFTTSFGNRVNMIEPVDNWISRFVCTKSELADSCTLLRSAKGKDLRLFLKLLVKAVNEDKRYNTSLSATTSSHVVDIAKEKAEQERLNREYGLPIYKYTGTPTTSTLSLEEIKRGYGPKMDNIYGLRFDGSLNLIGSPLDFNTASMLPFLMLSSQGLGRVPGFRINLNKPLSFMSTSGMVGGATVNDVFTNEDLDISTGFDLKSNEIKNTWMDLKGKLKAELESSYEQKIEKIINDLIQQEASLLNNLSRIQKLKQLLDADPSLISSGTGDSGAFKPEDVKKVADTFNTKMDEYRKSFNRASNILERLNGQTLMGVFKYTDIDI